MAPTLEELIEQLVGSGKVPAELLGQLQAAMDDPAKLDEVLGALKDMGADELGTGPLLNIEDFYREGTALYELRWPLGTNLPFPFSQLDRKTQFFVLFQEWTRRDMEGAMALTEGRLADAKQIFDEGLERARQIEVGELMARSYEQMGRVAERMGERAASREYSQKAAQARAA